METGQRYSPIADSFASRLKWISGRPPREQVTIGIILLVFGVVAFGISPWLAWFTVASGLLLLTWHSRMQGTWRGLLYFFALLPVLHIAQDEFGHLPDPVIELVAKTCDVSPAHVFGVVTFYTMFHRARHGRNELMVCTNISCMLKGGYEILHHIEQKLGIKPGQTTPDGAFTLVEEECLAACANAPMMICGQDYFLDLTPQKVDTILDDLAIPMGIVRAGHRVVYEPGARAHEHGSETATEEFARKSRVIAGAVQFMSRRDSSVRSSRWARNSRVRTVSTGAPTTFEISFGLMPSSSCRT